MTPLLFQDADQSHPAIEGTIDHLVLGIYHVVEYTYDKLPYDLAFLASGIILLLLGCASIRQAITSY